MVRGRSIPNDQLAAAYRSAGVVLNDHHDDMRADGFVSNRLFDAVASGARVITDEVAGLAELFGPAVQVYETPDDLARLATLADSDSVFGDDATRRAAADRVRTEHSFAARAARLVEVAHEARAEPHAGIARRLSRRPDRERPREVVGVGDAEQVALEHVDRRVGDGGQQALLPVGQVRGVSTGSPPGSGA